MSALQRKVVSLNDHKEKQMGNPQLEDGYVKVSNELFDAVIIHGFSGRQIKVLMAIIRKTYGFNKKSDEIGLSQFQKMTGLDPKHVSIVLQELEQLNVVTITPGSSARRISINKMYNTWVSPEKGESLKKGVSLKEVKGYPQNGCLPIPKLGNTKDSLQKTVYKRQSLPKKSAVSIATWLQNCKDEGTQPVEESDTIFDYAEEAGISHDMLRLCWLEFKAQHVANKKRKIDWRAHFRNAVRLNWYKVWAVNADGKAYLTSVGRQAMNAFKGVEV